MDDEVCHRFLTYHPSYENEIKKLREPKNLESIKSVNG